MSATGAILENKGVENNPKLKNKLLNIKKPPVEVYGRKRLIFLKSFQFQKDGQFDKWPKVELPCYRVG